MSNKIDQILIENIRSKRAVSKEIKETYSMYLDSISEQLQTAKNYLQDRFIELKSNKEIKSFKYNNSLGYDEIINLALLASIEYQKPTIVNSLIAKIAGILEKSTKETEVLNKSSFLILSSLVIDSLIVGKLLKYQKVTNNVKIVSSFPITMELQEMVNKSVFLPPSLCKPKLIKSNKESGLLTMSESVILGKENYHNKPLNLNFINKVNRVPMRLTFIAKEKEQFNAKELSIQAVQNRLQKIKERAELLPIIEDRKFYFRHKWDSRGRRYQIGYHFNYQGNDYERASLGLAKPIKVSQRGKYWLKITQANYYGNGLDKMSFKKRLKLYSKITNPSKNAEEYYQHKAVTKLIDDNVTKTNIVISLDATSSGTQMLSVLSHCEQSMSNCNLLGKTIKDPPMLILEYMQDKGIAKDVTRKVMKDCYMTSLYGSLAKPRELWTTEEELINYYLSIKEVFPGVSNTVSRLHSVINSNVITETWQLLDKHTAHTSKVVLKQQVLSIANNDVIHTFEEVDYDESSVAIIAHVTHSVDALVERQVTHRANYDVDIIKDLKYMLITELDRKTRKRDKIHQFSFIQNFPEFNIEYISQNDIFKFSKKQLKRLLKRVDKMLLHEPYNIFTVHDAYAQHCNYVDKTKDLYLEVMSDLTRYRVLDFIIYQIQNNKVTMADWESNKYIKLDGKYAIC